MSFADTLATGTLTQNIPVNTDTPTNLFVSGTFFPFVQDKFVSPATRLMDAFQLSKMLGIQQGYIRENAGQLMYITGSSYMVLTGAAEVSGRILTWTAVTRTGVTMTSGTMTYVYVYASGTTGAIEESTSIPVWDSTLNYYYKAGDTSRRCLGYLTALNTNTIQPFFNVVHGRISEIEFIGGASSRRVVNNTTTATGTWVSINLSPYVPIHATHALLMAKVISSVAGDDVALGLSPLSLGTDSAVEAPHHVRSTLVGGNSNAIFFGTAWRGIISPQTYYWRLTRFVGTGGAGTVEVDGSRFIR